MITKKILAADEDNVWSGTEFYDFILNEAIVYEEDGASSVIPSNTLNDFQYLSQKYEPNSHQKIIVLAKIDFDLPNHYNIDNSPKDKFDE